MIRDRLLNGLRRLWPKTLFAQLTLIMVTGTLAVQLLSSSIWFDVRFAQVLEAPLRLMASRSADLIRQGGCHPDEVIKAPANYQVQCLDSEPAIHADLQRGARRTEMLLNQALTYELGHEQSVKALMIQLTDLQGKPVVWRSLFGLQTALTHVCFAVRLPDGHWLEVDGQELQGWSGESAWALITDYILRVYVLRIMAVLAICWIAVRLCLSPLKRMSDAARALGKNLDQPPLIIEGSSEVRQAARTFNSMQQRIVAMVNDQSFFLAAVSHDLRTPLTRMRLRIERLKEVDHRERLKQNVQQMDRMIAQVLDYLHSAKQHSFQFVDVDKLLHRLCTDLATKEENLPVTGRGGMIHANEVLLQRCLQNLLENALRYACQIEIHVERTQEAVLISITDRGPGITPSLLDSITDPFVRGESSRNGQSGGYGLGLSIAKRIAASQEGALELSNRQGGGLRVSVGLPYRRESCRTDCC
ncbi:ATP-binding protein [Pseudomonas botevensis]|uniref:ATP-binding protein n=1 Tax=Pseudomonas botevensis TaxID=2842352 RepID=UPI001C3E3A44|nr:ATP-binding protein [Pseudomonas botevensis]MBV4473594.1 HAMP domain-containing protein [Pseudomonas botevensis]